jgi:putative ABC transport system permease protein
VAGVMGSLLATAFTYLVLDRLFQVKYRWDVSPHVFSIVSTALLANAAGWGASLRIIGLKPLEVLRGE